MEPQTIMDKRTRLETAFALRVADRPPILGGWLAAPQHVCTLTGCTQEEYWEDPLAWSLAAEQTLGSDGLIDVFTPVSRGEYRCVDQRVLDKRAAYTVERMLAEIEAMPDAAMLRAGFDAEALYQEMAAEHLERQTACGDMVWCPADWKLIPKALWYEQFGYETALTALALYPDRYRKLIEVSAEQGRQRAVVRARMMREGMLPRALLTGEDLCAQRGPLVSPDYLRREYWHWVEYALEPLLAVGARVVWHCDGDYRPLLDDVLASGVGGLQGFQRECGMELEWIRNLCTRSGDPLLIFGAMSVTETLPHGTPEDVRAEVQRIIDLCRDHVGLAFMTSNTITPDVPFENLIAYYRAVQESAW